MNWTSDKETLEVEAKIAKRAKAMAEEMNTHYPYLDILMDIDACHSNGCPLRLADLLEADDVNFAHDIFGIRAHISRITGELKDCFVPRYAK